MEDNKPNKKYSFSKEDFNRNEIDFYHNNKEFCLSNKEFVYWGYDNNMPERLYSYYDKCSTLQAIIDGTVDFILGDRITLPNGPAENMIVNNNGDNLLSIITKVVRDFEVTGGGAIQVIRNVNNQITEIYALDITKCRLNEDGHNIYYSKSWSNYHHKAIKYPSFDNNSPTSIYILKNDKSRGVYPQPPYNSSLESIDVQCSIKRFHSRQIKTNFNANVFISFFGEEPEIDEKRDQEKKINNKFTGVEANPTMIGWFPDKESTGVDIQVIDTINFDTKFDLLNKTTQDDIFQSMRAPRQLFGSYNEQTGFNSQEYQSAFTLYNNITVKPIQKQIVNVFTQLGFPITIEPYILDLEDVDNNKNNDIGNGN